MSPPKETAAESAVTTALRRLYAARPEDFLAVRKALAAELKARGEIPSARRVAEARKPTRTIWAINRVAREDAALVRRVVEARDAAMELGGDDAPRTVATYRKALAAVVQAAAEVLAKEGAPAGPEQRRGIAATVEAAVTDTEFLRAQLLDGRLEHDATVEDPVAVLAASLDPRALEPRKREKTLAPEAPAEAKARAREPDAEARERRREADRAKKAREQDEARAAREKERALANARKEHARVKAMLERAIAEEEKARAKLEAAKHEVASAAESVRELRERLTAAERAVARNQ